MEALPTGGAQPHLTKLSQRATFQKSRRRLGTPSKRSASPEAPTSKLAAMHASMVRRVNELERRAEHDNAAIARLANRVETLEQRVRERPVATRKTSPKTRQTRRKLMEEMLGSEPIPTPSSPVSVLHTFSPHFEAENASFAQHDSAVGGNARSGNTRSGTARSGNALAGEANNGASVALRGTAVMESASGGDLNSGAVADGMCNGVSSGGFSSLAVRLAARRRERMHMRLSACSQVSAAEPTSHLAGGTPTPRSHLEPLPSMEAAEVKTVAELWRRCREPVASQPGAMIDSLELELLHQERVRRAQALFAHLDHLIGSDGASSKATAGTHRSRQPMAVVVPTWKEMAPKALLDVPDNCCYESYCHRLV